LQQSKTLIVADHPAFRQGIRQLLSSETRFEVCAEANRWLGRLQNLVQTSNAEMLILDIDLLGSMAWKLPGDCWPAESPVKIVT